MTRDEKNELREYTSMKLFNFYLDDFTKLEVIKKLRENGVEPKKGALAALIRVLLTYFTELIPDDPTFEYFIREIEREYLFTTKKNKRSRL